MGQGGRPPPTLWSGQMVGTLGGKTMASEVCQEGKGGFSPQIKIILCPQIKRQCLAEVAGSRLQLQVQEGS